MKYRSEVEAFKYDGDLMGSDGNYYIPNWAIEAYENDIMYYSSVYGGDSWEYEHESCDLFIKNSDQNVTWVPVGNYVLKHENGHLFTLKEEDFETRYEPIQIYTRKDSVEKERNKNGEV